MANVTARTYVPVKNPQYDGLKAITTGAYYQGQIVFFTTSGITRTAIASKVVAGICAETVTVATAGEQVNVLTKGVIGIPNTNFTAAHIGTLAYAYLSGTASNNVADALPDASARATDMPLGLIVDVNSEGFTWVDLGIRATPVAKS